MRGDATAALRSGSPFRHTTLVCAARGASVGIRQSPMCRCPSAARVRRRLPPRQHRARRPGPPMLPPLYLPCSFAARQRRRHRLAQITRKEPRGCGMRLVSSPAQRGHTSSLRIMGSACRATRSEIGVLSGATRGSRAALQGPRGYTYALESRGPPCASRVALRSLGGQLRRRVEDDFEHADPRPRPEAGCKA